ncbi:MAG: hypothetical protein M1828_000220 [Chrysothrix sp. TS-e1954]|nr:MAG: hypothetical protein M1828_000220 [Chrysothrix sp. TS-e1954]
MSRPPSPSRGSGRGGRQSSSSSRGPTRGGQSSSRGSGRGGEPQQTSQPSTNTTAASDKWKATGSTPQSSEDHEQPQHQSDVQVFKEIMGTMRPDWLPPNPASHRRFSESYFELPLFRCHEKVQVVWQLDEEPQEHIIKAVEHTSNGFVYRVISIGHAHSGEWRKAAEDHIDLRHPRHCAASRLERQLIDCGIANQPRHTVAQQAIRQNEWQYRKSRCEIFLVSVEYLLILEPDGLVSQLAYKEDEHGRERQQWLVDVSGKQETHSQLEIKRMVAWKLLQMVKPLNLLP